MMEELRAQRVKEDRSFFWVGLTDQTKVFIPFDATMMEEHKYTQFLKVKAKSKKEAINIVVTKLLVSEYRIIVDRLWAWR